MYRKQIIFVGLAIAALMALYPPWRIAVPTMAGTADLTVGYDFVGSPPNQLAFVDLGRLIAQWGGVAAFTAMAALLGKRRS